MLLALFAATGVAGGNSPAPQPPKNLPPAASSKDFPVRGTFNVANKQGDLEFLGTNARPDTTFRISVEILDATGQPVARFKQVVLKPYKTFRIPAGRKRPFQNNDEVILRLPDGRFEVWPCRMYAY